MKPLYRLALLSLGLCLGTALFALVVFPTAPGYYPSLRLHIGSGWALLALGLPALFLHLRRTNTRARWVLVYALMAAALAVPSMMPPGMAPPLEFEGFQSDSFRDLFYGRNPETSSLWGPRAVSALALLSLALTLVGFLPRFARWSGVRWSGLAVLTLLLWAAITGIGQGQVERAHRLQAIAIHTGVGVVTLLVALQHAFSALRWTKGRPPWEASARTLVAVLVAGAFVAGIYFMDMLRPGDPSESPPGMILAQTAGSEGQRKAATSSSDTWEHLPPESLKSNTTCGSAGCHPTIAREWLGSPHRWSAQNEFYRKAAGRLIEAGRMDQALFCANCHDPERALSGTLAADYATGVPTQGSDGVSCLICHSMVEAHGTPGNGEPGNGLFTVAVSEPIHSNQGDAFRDAVDLDLRRHFREFAVDGFVQDRLLCESCHRTELGPDHGLADLHVVQDQVSSSRTRGEDQPQCQECHLPRRAQRLDSYSHSMAGINADLALYATEPDPTALPLLAANSTKARFLAGLGAYVPIEDPSWPTSPPPAPAEDETIASPGSRALGFRVETERLTHSAVDLIAHTWNARIGHDFPSGPLDLQEIWLELQLTDATGAVLVHWGALAPDGAVTDPAGSLGATELDGSGSPLTEHRILELAKVENTQLLPRGDPAAAPRVDRWTVPLPDGVSWPLRVRARWMFRRANPAFVAWALGAHRSPLPAWELNHQELSLEEPDPP